MPLDLGVWILQLNPVHYGIHITGFNGIASQHPATIPHVKLKNKKNSVRCRKMEAKSRDSLLESMMRFLASADRHYR